MRNCALKPGIKNKYKNSIITRRSSSTSATGSLKVTRPGCLAQCQHVSITSVMERPAEDGLLWPGTCSSTPSLPTLPSLRHECPASYKHLLCGLNGAGCTPLTLISIFHCPPIDGEGDSICACLAWCHPFNRHMLHM